MSKKKNDIKKSFINYPLDFSIPKALELVWPNEFVIPLNLEKLNRRIFTLIKKDINVSEDYLIITGFTSLAQIIDFFGCHADWEKVKKIKIVLGWEPIFKERKKYKDVELEIEVKNYWLSNRFSIIAKGGGYVIRIIELIKSGSLDFRFYNTTNDRLHAKIYVGDTHAQAGSANFSETGLNSQLEFMMRFEKNGNEKENQYYDYLNLTAKNYYDISSDFNNKIIEILESLLSIVTWQEALSRAIHEILNRNSMYNELPELHNKINSLKLWPSQKYGLHQALMILQKNGCVLIADPTGSGKTKMITTLQMLTFNWLLETGRRYENLSLTIAPPLVKEQWKLEFSKLEKFASAAVKSMGILSQSKGVNYQEAKDKLGKSNILIIDEAHNYLNNSSIRSKAISNNLADYVILSTATPINKHVGDLLRVIELLGIDNLGDDEIVEYKKLRNSKGQKGKQNVDKLQHFISKIIVRRTKPELRTLISSDKDSYKDRYGNSCSYPIQNPKTYQTGESHADRQIAKKINKLAEKLRGIIYLQQFKRPKEYFIEDEKYIEMRVKMANKLSIYNLQATMRSSKAALLEHILGTEKSIQLCNFDSNKKPFTGNIILKLEECKGRTPKSEFPQALLPDWLRHSNAELYQEYCDEEINIYSQISELAIAFSNDREISKVKNVVNEFSKTAFIVAFDSIPLTLDYLKHIASENFPEAAKHIYVVTGNTSRTIIKSFGNEKDESIILEKGILFCSDVLSEGVGLQKASTIFFLDMPSVIRLAEQRIGRIERLDSSFNNIDVFWPLDTDEFALKTDRRLIKTLNDVASTIGANFGFPDNLINLERFENSIIRPNDMIRELKKAEKEDNMWEGIQDSFKPVFELFDDKKGLIKRSYYEKMKGVKADIKLRISKGFSNKQWCFIAFKSTKKQPPRWFFIDYRYRVETELPQICEALRDGIGNIREDDWENKNIDDNDWKLVRRYMNRIKSKAIEHLPNKKKRALRIAKELLERQLKIEKDTQIKELIGENEKLLQPLHNVEDLDFDYESFAQMWLDILSPYLSELKNKFPRKIITLDNLVGRDINIKFDKNILESLIKNAPYTESLWERITNLIVAVPYSKPTH